MSITAVRLRVEDWPLWRSLRLRALAESPHAFGSTLADWSGEGDTEARWRARLESVPFHAVLWLHGEPAGMVAATLGTAGEVELISLWVAAQARGHGLGDAAIGVVIDWALTTHGGVDVVLSVKRDNDPAIRLYLRNNFVDVGLSPDDPDERLMRRHAGPIGRDMTTVSGSDRSVSDGPVSDGERRT